MYLTIENNGLLEVGALSLMGASTKRGDTSKIGMFGSGNKYALAYLLRNGYDIKIFSGNKEVKIETKKEPFRDREFEVIYIDGEKTSITTELGKDWDLWQSIRELYSNGVDEGLLTFEIKENDFQPLNDDTTRILIGETPELSNFMFNIQDYIATGKEVLHENKKGKIYRKHGGKACVYRKGIKVFETGTQSVYDYDLHSIGIGENRLAGSMSVYSGIWEILYNCDNEEVIRNVLYSMSQDSKLLENKLDEGFGIYCDMTDEWKGAVKSKKVCPRKMGGYLKDEERQKTLLLPDRLYNKIIEKAGTEAEPQSFLATASGAVYNEVENLTALQVEIGKECRAFLKECKFNIPYEIKVVSFPEKRQMGGVSGETILIDVDAFDKGKDFVVGVIIEEYIHIKHDVCDETREFQNASISELVNYMKEINAYNL
jgi:hypothetical protein